MLIKLRMYFYKRYPATCKALRLVLVFFDDCENGMKQHLPHQCSLDHGAKPYSCEICEKRSHSKMNIPIDASECLKKMIKNK